MSTGYITLSRQAGLLGEMSTIANNIANMSTTGFRREGVVFSEYIRSANSPEDSVSMAAPRARQIDLTQGTLDPTGGTFDFALQGEGFFLLGTPQGERLTRAGSFQPNDAGDLVSPDGNLLLDEGGSPIFIPPDAEEITLAADGTLSVDGRAMTRLAIVKPSDGSVLSRESGALFSSEGGFEPAEDGSVVQGFVESSNVNPVLEITRMIEVQRAYELGQSFNDREGERLAAVIKTLGG